MADAGAANGKPITWQGGDLSGCGNAEMAEKRAISGVDAHRVAAKISDIYAAGGVDIQRIGGDHFTGPRPAGNFAESCSFTIENEYSRRGLCRRLGTSRGRSRGKKCKRVVGAIRKAANSTEAGSHVGEYATLGIQRRICLRTSARARHCGRA